MKKKIHYLIVIFLMAGVREFQNKAEGFCFQ